MELLLVRHGEAVPTAGAATDGARALSASGRAQMRGVARALGRLGLRLDRLHHSPLLRAVESAQLLTGALKGPTRVDPGLAVAPSESLLRGLGGERLALVGHEPHLGRLATVLLRGWSAVEGRPAALALRKGAVAWLEGEPRAGACRLRALLPPEALEALAGTD